jgi:uncharacterized protein YaaN involved in tellurite resistance
MSKKETKKENATPVEPAVAVVVESTSTELSVEDARKYELAKKASSSLDTSDPNTILNYGIEVTNKLSSHSDAFLANVRLDKSEVVGAAINSLLSEINELDVNDMNKNAFQKFMSKVPILNKLTKGATNFIKRYDDAQENFNEITQSLDQARLEIVKDTSKLNNLFDSNLDFIGEVEISMEGAKIKIDEVNQEIELLKESGGSKIDIDNKLDFVNRLEKRLHDMDLTRTITVQTLPQIRIVQTNNITLAEKIQSSINTTLPLWKNQIALSLTLIKQKKLAELEGKIFDVTNTILKSNADTLKSNSIDIANSNERGVVSIDTINEVQTKLVETMNEIQNIKRNGTQKRKEVLGKLIEIQSSIEDQSPTEQKQLN